LKEHRVSYSKKVSRFLLAALTLASSAAMADYSRLVVFGDSMSDTHRLYDYTTKNWGESDPGPPNYDGRFSDGLVAVEFLAQSMRLPLVNYSFAGATSGYDTLLLVTEGMLTQVNEYLTNPGVVPPVQTVSSYMIKPAKPKADPEALHMIWTGPDDFYRLLIGMTNLTGYSVVSNVKQAVGSLYGAGARHFFIPLMPDISMTPSAKTHDLFQPGYIWSARYCTDSFKKLLTQAIAEMKVKYPDAKFMSHDTLTFMREEFARVKAEGKNITGTCRKEGAFDPKKLSTGAATACPNPEDYVFWDGNHPTAWVNKVLADEWFAAINAQR
jgi:phospholipase/lecithinase/hemolysin